MQIGVLGSYRIDIGGRPIVMQMSVLASRPYRYWNEYRSTADSYADERVGDTPYRYRISPDSYGDPRVGSAGLHIGAPPTVMQMNVLESRLRIGLIPYGCRSSADSYADERVGDTTV
jgi:hypothetical protein